MNDNVQSINDSIFYFFAHYNIQFDNNDLKMIFDYNYKMKEQLESYITIQYLTLPKLRNDNILLISFSIKLYQSLIKIFNAMLNGCCFLLFKRLLHYIASKFYLGCNYYNKFKDGQLSNLIWTLDGENYILYTFTTDNIKLYFYELIDKNLYTKIDQIIETLQQKVYFPELEKQYPTIKFTYGVYYLLLDPNNNDLNKRLLYSKLTEEKVKQECERLVYLAEHHYILKNIQEYLRIFNQVSKQLKLRLYRPKFLLDYGIDFNIGKFGLKKLPKNLYSLLVSAFRKIYASMFLFDYPLSSIIIHRYAYIIEAPWQIQNHKIFAARYFGSVKIFVTDLNGNKVSLRQKRKILYYNDYKKLMQYVATFFKENDSEFLAFAKGRLSFEWFD